MRKFQTVLMNLILPIVGMKCYYFHCSIVLLYFIVRNGYYEIRVYIKSCNVKTDMISVLLRSSCVNLLRISKSIFILFCLKQFFMTIFGLK